jgi:glycerate dehydrogenase
MKVIAHDGRPTDRGKHIARYVSMDELFARSDVICLHCPLFPETTGIINKANIAKKISYPWF